MLQSWPPHPRGSDARGCAAEVINLGLVLLGLGLLEAEELRHGKEIIDPLELQEAEVVLESGATLGRRAPTSACDRRGTGGGRRLELLVIFVSVAPRLAVVGRIPEQRRGPRGGGRRRFLSALSLRPVVVADPRREPVTSTPPAPASHSLAVGARGKRKTGGESSPLASTTSACIVRNGPPTFLAVQTRGSFSHREGLAPKAMQLPNLHCAGMAQRPCRLTNRPYTNKLRTR